jgi:macrodomain Ter protein organizer (MatP/YcbG family)
MRTTLDLEKPILEALKKRGKREGMTLSKLASQLLAEAMANDQSGKSKLKSLKWVSSPMGARVDISDKEVLYRLLDQP